MKTIKLTIKKIEKIIEVKVKIKIIIIKEQKEIKKTMKIIKFILMILKR